MDVVNSRSPFGMSHWEIYCDLIKTSGVAGSETQDAWLAAMAIEHGCEWITFDEAFARFPGLR